MVTVMRFYLEGLSNTIKIVLENGAERDDRTGVGTLSTFGERLAFDLVKDYRCNHKKFICTR